MIETEEKQSILLVDDAPLHLLALHDILHETYHVTIAKSGEEGLALALKENTDLILLDLVLPGMSGFDVLVKLKEEPKTKDIPVIILTGSDAPEDEIKGLDLGAVDYIKKPFISRVVKQRVGIHLKLLAQMRIIEQFSLTDGLTGISNRRSYDKAIRSEWSRAMREQTYLGKIMMDIDHFKIFNDTHGHLNGDYCLKVMARVLTEKTKRSNDHVFRWGGEEFAILLPSTNNEGVIAVAENIRKAIEETPIGLDNGEVVFVTASFGAGAVIPPHAESEETIQNFCAYIDRALYIAKEKGRNRVQGLLNNR
jgi:diguanylate cyclase (GGDEF)-like protein